MSTVTGLLNALAIVALAGAGGAAIVGLRPLRDRLLGAAVVFGVLALALNVMGAVSLTLSGAVETGNGVSGNGINAVSNNGGVNESGTLAVGAVVALGHVALGVVLVRRRLRRNGRGQDEAAEILAARGRRRPRLTPSGQETGP